jgi:hypothetical protein
MSMKRWADEHWLWSLESTWTPTLFILPSWLPWSKAPFHAAWHVAVTSWLASFLPSCLLAISTWQPIVPLRCKPAHSTSLLKTLQWHLPWQCSDCRTQAATSSFSHLFTLLFPLPPALPPSLHSDYSMLRSDRGPSPHGLCTYCSFCRKALPRLSTTPFPMALSFFWCQLFGEDYSSHTIFTPSHAFLHNPYLLTYCLLHNFACW